MAAVLRQRPVPDGDVGSAPLAVRVRAALAQVYQVNGGVHVGCAVAAIGWFTAFTALTIDNLDDAIENVSFARSSFGAVQNRLEHRLNNLSTYQENLVASESRIRDVDMANEMVNFTKLGILQQAGTSMLAQANQSPQGVLSLLQG